jgi:hypothetical protein
MVAALSISASFLGWAALFAAAWAMLPREQRMMTGALGLAALSLVYATAAAVCQHHYEAVVLGGIGVLIVAVLIWRTWPDGWRPWRDLRKNWREFRRRTVPNRIAGNKES